MLLIWKTLEEFFLIGPGGVRGKEEKIYLYYNKEIHIKISIANQKKNKSTKYHFKWFNLLLILKIMMSLNTVILIDDFMYY